MTLDDVLDALSEREVFSPIMIMPFLPDEEVSVDCLDTEKGLIALPRIKGNNKYELLRFDEDIISICRDFQNKVGLKCPYNIQFKYLDGIPYFLEVNTRMSGGIQMACYASGVNIPQLALKKISGEELDWSCKYEEKILAQVLQPVTID
jgi:predicted ATP-grasp superfamily ATP-dependent carboligase